MACGEILNTSVIMVQWLCATNIESFDRQGNGNQPLKELTALNLERLPVAVVLNFILCVCGCLLSVDSQDADVLQKFALCVWVDRRSGPFASVCCCLRRVC